MMKRMLILSPASAGTAAAGEESVRTKASPLQNRRAEIIERPSFGSVYVSVYERVG